MVPLGAVIIEGIVLVIVTYVVAMLYVRYADRRRNAALALAVAFTFWDIAIVCLFVNRILAYLTQEGLMNPVLVEGVQVNWSDLGVNLGYGFSALSNVFIVVFVALLFAQSPLFRRTGMILPINIAGWNGITIGLLIAATIGTWPEPKYELVPTLFHLFVTFTSFTLLIFFTIKPYRQATYRWEKAGFLFIILSGVSGFLLYLSFALDFVAGDENLLNWYPEGFTPFFFLAYVFGMLMCIFAYFGYVMPDFIRNLFKEKEEATK